MDPNAPGVLYCPEQIKIPGELPDILKDFTKAAIRTQPTDLLQWSAAYFEALRTGEVPPVKQRLEPSLISPEARHGGLTKGALAVLHRQFGSQESVKIKTVKEKWVHAGCTLTKLEELLLICGGTEDTVEWKKLLVLACTVLEKTMADALCMACEIISPDPVGGPARVDIKLFRQLYVFLVDVDGEVPKRHVEDVMEFLTLESQRYNGTVGPRDFTHSLCPRLDARD